MMDQFQTKNGEIIYTLTTADVLDLHNILCDNYRLLPEMEPISPSGVKNMNMLESAVSRQTVGSGNYYKYPDAYTNCATLVYGLVKNHAFHNGNKRIGFLCLLKHSYVNGRVIKCGVKHDEIYELLRCLADDNLGIHAYSFAREFFKIKKSKVSSWSSELDIPYLSFWLRYNTEHKNTKIKLQTIPVSDLQAILQAKKLTVRFDGRFLEIVRPIRRYQEWLGNTPFKRVYSIKKGKTVTLKIVDDIRRDFNLTLIDGVDNSSFYDDDHILSEEIISYKRIIYRLAKT